ncbi:hypothetical protein J4226_03145 [Candidatus Pacearchaeota archaeon]|nr:hypothetical protein [Candidatus Pacearchaeota archaeon]
MKIRNFHGGLGVWGFGGLVRSLLRGGLGVWGFGGLVRASPGLSNYARRYV